MIQQHKETKMELEAIEKRLLEIPTILESLKAEFNQLLGYKKALTDSEEELKTEKESKE